MFLEFSSWGAIYWVLVEPMENRIKCTDLLIGRPSQHDETDVKNCQPDNREGGKCRDEKNNYRRYNIFDILRSPVHDVQRCKDYDTHDVNGEEEDEEEEVSVVVFTYTVVHPRTVMIEHLQGEEDL